MLQSDLFAYLAAFVTIVLAIALSDMIQSLHRLLRARERVTWDALPLVAALYVYLTILSEFFSLWAELRVVRFTYVDLVAAMIGPTLVSLAAFAVLPDEVPAKGLNLTGFYLRQRRHLVVLFFLMLVTSHIRILWSFHTSGYHPSLQGWLWFGSLTLVHVAIFAVIWRAEDRRPQLVALLFLIAAGWEAYFRWSVEVAR